MCKYEEENAFFLILPLLKTTLILQNTLPKNFFLHFFEDFLDLPSDLVNSDYQLASFDY